MEQVASEAVALVAVLLGVVGLEDADQVGAGLVSVEAIGQVDAVQEDAGQVGVDQVGVELVATGLASTSLVSAGLVSAILVGCQGAGQEGAGQMDVVVEPLVVEMGVQLAFGEFYGRVGAGCALVVR